jgi:periplasmic divalent cation tolerance protein
MIVIFLVIHDKKDAITIADSLLERRLIAGYNLLGVESAFWWKGEVLREPEAVLLLKTRRNNFAAIEEYVKKATGAEVPDILALTPEQVGAAHAAWVQTESVEPN